MENDVKFAGDEANHAAWEVIFAWSNKGLLPSGFDKASEMMLDIHAAVLAERERCAKIAEGYVQVHFHLMAEEWEPGTEYARARLDAASAIREHRS